MRGRVRRAPAAKGERHTWRLTRPARSEAPA